MSSDDQYTSQDETPPPSRKKLVLEGDGRDFSQRESTVLFDEEQSSRGGSTPPTTARQPRPPPRGHGNFLDADELTPPPSGNGNFLHADEPTPPPSGNGNFLHADEPTPPPSDAPAPGPRGPSPPGDDAGSRRAVHDAEHITNTGFIPSETFRGPAVQGPQKKKFSLPNLSWLDDADTRQRLVYGASGFILGAFLGGILGVLNSFLQGWSITEGENQIFALAVVVGAVFAAMAAMKPGRIDAVLERLGLNDD